MGSAIFGAPDPAPSCAASARFSRDRRRIVADDSSRRSARVVAGDRSGGSTSRARHRRRRGALAAVALAPQRHLDRHARRRRAFHARRDVARRTSAGARWPPTSAILPRWARGRCSRPLRSAFRTHRAPDEVLETLSRHCRRCATRTKLAIAGGDLSRARCDLTIAITVVGEVRPLERQDARRRTAGRRARRHRRARRGARGSRVARESIRDSTASERRRRCAPFAGPQPRVAEGRFFAASRNVHGDDGSLRRPLDRRAPLCARQRLRRRDRSAFRSRAGARARRGAGEDPSASRSPAARISSCSWRSGRAPSHLAARYEGALQGERSLRIGSLRRETGVRLERERRSSAPAGITLR